MGQVKNTFIIEDQYSQKAEKIADSSLKIVDAFSKIKKTSAGIGSAFKGVFGRKYKVSIDDIAADSTRNKVQGLQKSLEGLSKPYHLEITAKKGVLEKLKDNVQAPFKKAHQVKVNRSEIRSAKKEAKDLSKELTAMTGKKHKVKLDFDGKTFKDKFKGAMSGLGGLNKKFLNFASFGKLGGGGGQGGGGFSGGGGSLMGSIIKGNLITSAIGKGVGIVKNGITNLVQAGTGRLESIQTAQAKMKGYGFDDKTVQTVTDNAMASVKGTAFGFNEAMGASTGLLAAGIKPGQQLQSVLTTVGNSAAAAGTSFEDMGSIFNKIASNGKADNQDLQQVADRGIPIYKALSDTMEMSIADVRKAVSDGKVGFNEFNAAMQKASGNVAKETAKTFAGAKDNLHAAFSRIGANLLGNPNDVSGEKGSGGLFATLTPAVMKATEALGPFEEKAKEVGTKIGEVLGPVIEKAPGMVEKAFNGLKEAFDFLKPIVEPIFESMKKAREGIKPSLEHIGGVLKDTLGPALGDLAQTLFPAIAKVLVALAPVIETLVIPAIKHMANFIIEYVIPAIIKVTNFITEKVVPVLQRVADFIEEHVVPAFGALRDFINDKVIGTFKSLIKHVRNAGQALAELPSKISGRVSDKVSSAVNGVKGFFGGKKKGHATGTTYFQGGLTSINERGEELIKLARGAKIYPAGATREIIKNDMRRNHGATSSKVVYFEPRITVNGANKADADIAYEINRELRKLMRTI